MSRSRPRCQYCGKAKPRGNHDPQYVCPVCRHVVAAAKCVPAWDRRYPSKVAAALMRRYGTWVPHLSSIVGGTSKDVWLAVELLRRHGFVIDGDRRRGYRLVGWRKSVGTRGAAACSSSEP